MKFRLDETTNHEFLNQVLQKMGFGPNFLQLIRTYCRNLSSCVLHNGFPTDIFFVKRGVRQGDPLSPLLFSLALETLICQIRENKNIKGFLNNGKEIKTTLFADDMTCFLWDDVDLSSVTSKSLYNAFKMAKQTPPSAQKRFQGQFPDVQFDWNEIYSLSFKVSLETKIREFEQHCFHK